MPRAVFFAIAMIAASGSVVSDAAAPADDAPPSPAIQIMAPEMAEAILGGAIVDRSGKAIGRLVDVLVDSNGAPQAGVIDFGGFLGIGARKVAVHWSTLHFAPDDGKHVIVLDMTPDEIKAAPAYSDPAKPAPVVTPAKATPVAGSGDDQTPAEPSPQ